VDRWCNACVGSDASTRTVLRSVR